MFLIDDILLAPISGIKFILHQIQKVADQQLNDETIIKEQLLELQMRLELGEISEQNYAAEEAELFARLRAIKARQMEQREAVHTAESSSIVIESGGEENPYWQDREPEP